MPFSVDKDPRRVAIRDRAAQDQNTVATTLTRIRQGRQQNGFQAIRMTGDFLLESNLVDIEDIYRTNNVLNGILAQYRALIADPSKTELDYAPVDAEALYNGPVTIPESWTRNFFDWKGPTWKFGGTPQGLSGPNPGEFTTAETDSENTTAIQFYNSTADGAYWGEIFEFEMVTPYAIEVSCKSGICRLSVTEYTHNGAWSEVVVSFDGGSNIQWAEGEYTIRPLATLYPFITRVQNLETNLQGIQLTPGPQGETGVVGQRGSKFLGRFASQGDLPAIDGSSVIAGDFAYTIDTGELFRAE